MNGIESDIGYTLPLLDAQIGLKDIYNGSANGFMKEDTTEHTFTFIYAQTTVLPQQQFVTFPPMVANKDLNIDDGTANIFNNVGSISQAFSNYVVLPADNGKKLKQIFIKTGSFNIHLTSNVLHNTSIIITFPTITKMDGNMLRLPMILTFDPTNPVPADTTISISLDTSVIDLTDNGISYNVLPYMFEFDLTKNPGSPPMAAGEKLSITQTFTINEYRGINGYVGKFELDSMNGENPVDLFNTNGINISEVKLKDPRIKFSIASGFGIPITIKVNKIVLVNTDGSELPIAIDFLADTFTMPAPTVVGSYAFGSYVIDRNNSNIDDIINNLASNPPKALKYNAVLYSNYNQVEVDNFLFDTSSLKVDVGFEIPLDIKIGKFAYNIYDTLSFPGADAFDLIRASLSSVTTNTLPLDLRMQMYFGRRNDSAQYKLDSSTQVIDSLFEHGFIISKAIVNDSGDVVSSPQVRSDAILDRAKYVYLRDVAKVNRMKVTFSFETSRDINATQQYIKIRSTQGFGMKLGFSVRGKQKIKTKK
jgi:hypothetical protein